MYNVLYCAFSGSCQRTFNASSGEATTPGYPNKLAFDTSCLLTFSGGRFKLTFENVSLPDRSLITIEPENAGFVIGIDIIRQSEVWYTNHIQSTDVRILSDTSSPGAFSGVRILYEKIPEGRYFWCFGLGMCIVCYKVLSIWSCI